MRPIRMALILALLVPALSLLATDASAQLNGHNFRGDFGLTSGTQPLPGWYLSVFYLNYDTDTVRDRSGDRITFDPDRRGSITAQGIAPFAWWVSDWKILGGNYSFAISPSFADSSIAAPVFGLNQETGFDIGDLYFQPINLGWHTGPADFTAGVGIFAPVGKYTDGADDNTGLGMWSYELFAGTTVYLDEARSWNLALTGFFEFHSEKEDSERKVGNILTLEGGFGKSFAQGAINVGVAYFGQWKLTDDDFGLDFPFSPDVGKHQNYGVGPEVVLPIAMKDKLIALVTARYLFEFGSESTTEGNALFIGLTFPVGVDWGQ